MKKMMLVIDDKEDFETLITDAVIKALENAGNKIFPEWMTLSQICEYTQYSRVTINKFIKTQNFPVSYPCEKPRFKKSQVDKWMKKNSTSRQ